MSLGDVERADAWREERTELLKCRVGASVVPIVGENERGRPVAIGSGVLLAIESDVLLLTAGHVLDYETKAVQPLPLYVGLGRAFLPLGSAHHTSEIPTAKSREDDKLDVGLVRLEVKSSGTWGVRFRCVLMIWILILFQVYVVRLALGFPLTKVKLDPAQRHAGFSGIGVTSLAKSHVDSEPVRWPNLAMEFDRENLRVEERISTGPEPRGMSGGALFGFDSLYARNPQEVKDRLEGILIGHRPRARLMVATHVSLFLQSIRYLYPHLRAAIPKSDITTVRSSTASGGDPGGHPGAK